MNKSSYKAPDESNVSIVAGESIRSKFGLLYERDNDSYRNDPIYSSFCKKIGMIQNEGARHGLCAGTVLLMVNSNYGYTWDTIPYGRMDEIAEFVKMNISRWIEFTAPDLHHTMNDIGAYKVPDKQLAAKGHVQGVAERLGDIILNRRGSRACTELAAKICEMYINDPRNYN